MGHEGFVGREFVGAGGVIGNRRFDRIAVRGEPAVGAQPQDPSLEPPLPENL